MYDPTQGSNAADVAATPAVARARTCPPGDDPKRRSASSPKPAKSASPQPKSPKRQRRATPPSDEVEQPRRKRPSLSLPDSVFDTPAVPAFAVATAPAQPTLALANGTPGLSYQFYDNAIFTPSTTSNASTPQDTPMRLDFFDSADALLVSSFSPPALAEYTLGDDIWPANVFSTIDIFPDTFDCALESKDDFHTDVLHKLHLLNDQLVAHAQQAPELFAAHPDVSRTVSGVYDIFLRKFYREFGLPKADPACDDLDCELNGLSLETWIQNIGTVIESHAAPSPASLAAQAFVARAAVHGTTDRTLQHLSFELYNLAVGWHRQSLIKSIEVLHSTDIIFASSFLGLYTLLYGEQNDTPNWNIISPAALMVMSVHGALACRSGVLGQFFHATRGIIMAITLLEGSNLFLSMPQWQSDPWETAEDKPIAQRCFDVGFQVARIISEHEDSLSDDLATQQLLEQSAVLESWFDLYCKVYNAARPPPTQHAPPRFPPVAEYPALCGGHDNVNVHFAWPEFRCEHPGFMDFMLQYHLIRTRIFDTLLRCSHAGAQDIDEWTTRLRESTTFICGAYATLRANTGISRRLNFVCPLRAVYEALRRLPACRVECAWVAHHLSTGLCADSGIAMAELPHKQCREFLDAYDALDRCGTCREHVKSL
ncbi:uncharacterized protein V1518DRAFT_420964 [Limtongia smithiae]|uniref:uncharacterized protein n=1 Tax=Limtongia smithiae TaxID=1125753 RepID=UPI0034CF399C